MRSGQKVPAREDLVECLLPDQTDAFRRMFNEHGLRAPEVTWSPSAADLASPLLKKFVARCDEMRGGSQVLRKDQLTFEAFKGLSEWLIHVAVEENGLEFRYLRFGDAVVEASGSDMTGQTTSDHPDYVALFFSNLYRAVMTTRAQVYSFHDSPREKFVRGWHRLIVPVADEAGAIVEMVVMTVPDNELGVGLELLADPVFVVSDGGSVAFLNKAARQFFSLPRILNTGTTLTDLTGISLDLRTPPDALLAENGTIETVELAQNGSMIERLDVKISAAEHRGEAFYIVVMRVMGN